MRRALSAIAATVLAGCFVRLPIDDVVDAPIDAPADAPVDAMPVDARPVDATPVDAAPVTSEGTISLLEIAVLNPGTAGTFYGQGAFATIVFTRSDQAPGPVMEEQAGPLGCKAWIYTPAQAAAARIGGDVSSIQITATGGTNRPMYPVCTYAAGLGYQCPHVNTSSTGGVIARDSAVGYATLTDTDVDYSAFSTINRYVRITGAANAANNGLFPILGQTSANTIIYVHPAVIAETLPGTATHVNLAMMGPTPTVADPGFLYDDLDFTYTNSPSFVATTPSTIGDDFTLTSAELNRLNAVPFDGAGFSIGCAAADCPTGSASGTALELLTTDAPIAGLSSFAMPSPVTRQVKIRCVTTSSTTVTLPAAYSSFLTTAGVTRVQAVFSRINFLDNNVPANVQATAGHAIVGYTNAP